MTLSDEPKDPGVSPTDTQIAGASPPGGMFASLRHRNYRLFFCGQLISLCGTWMQSVALPWLVYQLTGSKALLGLVSAAQHLPVFVLAFVGGVTADRYPKRYVLLCTQATMMISAFAFWGLTASHHISLPWIFGLALLSGTAFAFDVPTRQSFVIELVGKEHLMNAIALNSSTFNAARIIGPSIGGVVIGSLGVSHCFLLNGLSFLAVIAALLLMDVPPRRANGLSESLWRDIFQGLNYARQQPVIRTTLIMIAVSSIFGTSYYAMLPVFAKDVLHLGADGLGFMMACSGIGALTSALCLASIGNFPRKGALLLGAAIAVGCALEVFSWSSSTRLSLGCLVVAGSAMTLHGSTCNTLLQTTTPDDLRGRVMSLFSLGFSGMAPLGSLQVGFMAQYFGVHVAVGLGAAILGITGLTVLLTVPKLRKA